MSPAPGARPSLSDLVVTYHYVRPENSEGVTGVTPEEFDGQLGLIGRTHRFVGVDEFVRGGGGADGRARALITFDDGVKDQYEFALPVLERRGVPAVFFVPMRPVDPALDPIDAWTPQHLLHALAQEMGWSGLERLVRARVGEVVVDEGKMNGLYHYETARKRWLKYVMAFVLPAERAAGVLDEINRAGPRLRAAEWFMSREQLLDLQARGHALGGHGYAHAAYPTLTPVEQAWDMGRAAALMNGLFGRRARAIAFPFGRHDGTTRALAAAFGYMRAFTTEDRVDCKFLERALAERGLPEQERADGERSRGRAA